MSQLKISKTNTKLGPGVWSVSRSSKTTCPSSCAHFGPDLETAGNCYATKLERIYPNVKAAWENNLKINDWQQYRSFLLAAHKSNKKVRINVSGDFIKRDSIGREQLDIKYLNAWLKAFESIPANQRPVSWMYTHVADRRILQLQQYGVSIYGSVDNDKMLKKFKKAGFTLFAYNSKVRKGKQVKPFEIIEDKKVAYCMEQTGLKNTCEDCDFCVTGKSSIVFLQH